MAAFGDRIPLALQPSPQDAQIFAHLVQRAIAFAVSRHGLRFHEGPFAGGNQPLAVANKVLALDDHAVGDFRR